MRVFRSLLVVFISIGLVGCASTELEERCFPMLVTVGYDEQNVTYDIAFPKDTTVLQTEAEGADFKNSKDKYEGRLNKETDYNHLKVVVFEDDFLEQTKQYQEMLDYLVEGEIFPRNTYVCAVDDVEELKEFQNSISEDLGTYLEEYLKKHEENKDKLLTLGDLLDEKDNEETVLYLPYLEVEDNFLEWKGYVNTIGKKWKES